jgi:hypothetical protein
MPFINGRYHLNPAMGQALEVAREAEATRLAREHEAQSEPDDDFAPPSHAPDQNSGPIHHIEIEAAETVPAHSGRATPGFVARIHRASATGHSTQEAVHSAPLHADTHVFTDHRDLLNFLHDELSKHCERS